MTSVRGESVEPWATNAGEAGRRNPFAQSLDQSGAEQISRSLAGYQDEERGMGNGEWGIGHGVVRFLRAMRWFPAPLDPAFHGAQSEYVNSANSTVIGKNTKPNRFPIPHSRPLTHQRALRALNEVDQELYVRRSFGSARQFRASFQ